MVPFENDVKTYSIQTIPAACSVLLWFENDVKTYSIQTSNNASVGIGGLRMM